MKAEFCIAVDIADVFQRRTVIVTVIANIERLENTTVAPLQTDLRFHNPSQMNTCAK